MTETITGVCRLPEEPVWDEDGREVVAPGSLPAASAVAEHVRALGYGCTPFQPDLEHYSWTFEAVADGRRYYINVFHLETDLNVTVDNHSGCLFIGLPGRDEKFRQFVSALSEKMAADPRFEQVEIEVAPEWPGSGW